MRVARAARVTAVAAAFCLASITWAGSQRYVALISDVHVGAGKLPSGAWNPIEDFRWQPEFDAFLAQTSKLGQGRADLVLVGDVFELWQSPTMTCSTDLSAPGCVVTDCNDADTEIGCSEAQALARLTYVIGQHPQFIDSLRKFAQQGSNRVHVIPGNHDAALLFPRVQKFLQDKFAGTRVQVLSGGSWLSDDGLIYADHGHQFDDVNQFDEWPSPFVERGGQTYLRKPWGENMVQQFYNQYEGVFPIVDNLSSESDGVEFAIHETGIGNTIAAVGRFARFYLFQQSLRQARIGLGESDGRNWDRKLARQEPAQFFLDVFNNDPTVKAKLLQADSNGTLKLDPSKLTDEEIDAVCASKGNIKDAQPCPPKDGGNLSATLKGVVFSEQQRIERYLKSTFQKLSEGGKPVPQAYVYAHTHSAHAPEDLTITDMPSGPARIKYANTGAFQRVASKAQIQKIIDAKLAPSVMQIQPEQLPPCYSYIWIEPYAQAPTMKLMMWKRGADGQWLETQGSCQSAK